MTSCLRPAAAALSVLAVFAFGADLFAQTVRPLVYPTVLEPATLDDDALYGAAVGVDGDRAIVGAPGEDSGRGAVFIHDYASGQWNAGVRLQASDGAATDQFGASVAVNGNVIYVGAPGDDDKGVDAGAVYVYTRIVLLGGPVWVLDQKVFGSDTVAGDRFGASLSAQNGVLVVGAPNDNITFSDQGSAYAFENLANTWTQTGKLLGTNAQVNEHFGTAVAYHGNRAIVGGPGFDNVSPAKTDVGRASIFLRTTPGGVVTWTKLVDLNPNDPVTSRKFGTSVAIEGARVAVGATGAWNFGSQASGAGYIFDLIGVWTQTAKMLPISAGAGDSFGSGVALLDGSAFVASPVEVVRFELNAAVWSEKETLAAPFADLVAAPYAELGSALAVDAPHLLVGRASAFASDEGSVLPFHTFAGTWTILTGASVGSNGFPKIRGAGPQVGGTPLTLKIEDGKTLAPAIMLIRAGAPSNVAYAGGILRAFPFQSSLTLPLNGSGELALPTVMPAGLSNVQLVLQMMVIDAGGAGGVALSNGLEMITAP